MKERILELSKKHKLSHIGSCLSVLPILQEIYKKKNPEDLVVLDNAHAHLAHLVVKEFEAREGYDLGMGAKFDAEELLIKNGIHCDRSVGCDATGGSLGHGIGISIGLALANKTRQVYCIVSDGSMMEGSNWEALRLKEDLGLTNLHIYANLNKYTAVAEINRIKLGYRMLTFDKTIELRNTENGEGFEGVAGHYVTI